MEWLLQPDTWIAFASLAALEIVLGIDNIVFISILASRLPEDRQKAARRLGLLIALVMRVLLLFSIKWVIGLTEPLFAVLGHEISGRDLILLGGGLFLLGKSTHEIHNKLEGEEQRHRATGAVSFGGVIVQIGLLDMVFSIDSVITAIGLADEIWIMVAAIVVAIGVMMWAAEPISAFVDKHPTIRMLALSFLLLIGFTLIAEGVNIHIPKGYIYFAMGFSLFVEFLNLRIRRRRGRAGKPVELHGPHLDKAEHPG